MSAVYHHEHAKIRDRCGLAGLHKMFEATIGRISLYAPPVSHGAQTIAPHAVGDHAVGQHPSCPASTCTPLLRRLHEETRCVAMAAKDAPRNAYRTTRSSASLLNELHSLH